MLRIVLYIIIVIALIGGGFYFYLTRGLGKYRKMVIHEFDLVNLSDGVYQGEFKGGRWKNKTAVTVKDHQISKLELLQPSSGSFGMAEIGEKIFDRVKEKQSLQIDTVSGATVHTKAILKSIENALSQKTEG